MGSIPSPGFNQIFRVPILIGSIAFALLWNAALAAPTHGDVAQTIQPQEWQVLVDRAGLLDEGQRASAVGDASRLNAIGIPTQVIIEPTGFNQVQADTRADELRTTSGIESSPGADDGLLVYASVAGFSATDVVVSISTGANFFPNGGLTRGDMDTIRETIVQPQLAEGHPARAIVYSMREMLYQQTFTPPPTPPMNETWLDVRQPFQVASVAIAAAAAAACIWSVRRGGGWLSFLVTALIASGMFALAILTRSGLAITSSLALFATVLTCAWLGDREPPAADHVRIVRATPRPPGRFRVISR